VLLLEFVEEIQHLGAHGDVERRDRLVGDHEARPAHDGAGDRDALVLAARELVRIALGTAVAQAHLGRISTNTDTATISSVGNAIPMRENAKRSMSSPRLAPAHGQVPAIANACFLERKTRSSCQISN